MRTITALFDTYPQAASAVRSLKDAGIPSDDISLVANNATGDVVVDESVEDGAETGAAVGAVGGGGAGLLVGLGALAVPGVGPVVAAGWLLATAVGAIAGAAVGGAAGGLLGALANAGVPEREAHAYAEGVRRGGSLVSVRAEDERADSVAAILRAADGVDIEQRRNDYIAEGWRAFDEEAPAYTGDQVRDYRSAYGVLPPIP